MGLQVIPAELSTFHSSKKKLTFEELASHLFKLGNIKYSFQIQIEKLRQSHYCPHLVIFQWDSFDCMNCEIPVNKNYLQKLVRLSDSLNDVKKKKRLHRPLL